MLSQAAIRKFAVTTVAMPGFESVSTGVILLNSAILGMLTYRHELLAAHPEAGNLIAAVEGLDTLCLLFFTAELLLRLLASGRGFFREPWNVFDFATVVVSLLAQNPLFAAIRVLRILRIFRLLSRFRTLRLISSVMVGSLSGCFSISLIMALVMFVFAIVGNELYGAASPEQFGNLHRAMHTLFKVSSLYDYDSVVTALADKHPSVYWYLIPFFLLMSYVFINFFSAIVVFLIYEVSFDEIKSGKRMDDPDALAEAEPVSAADSAASSEVMNRLDELLREVAALREEVRSRRSA